jgi:hypothetical protein
MPTYINSSQQQIAVDYYLPNLTKISDTPLVRSGIVVSQEVIDAVLDIPINENCRINVSIYSAAGATVYIADDTDGVIIPAGSSYTFSDEWRWIGKVRVDGTATVTVELGR